MFLGKPKIKQKTIVVKKAPAPASKPSPSPRTPSAQFRPNGARRHSTAGPPATRYQSTPLSHSKARDAARTSLAVSRVDNRKRKTTPNTPQWASSDESSDEEEDDRLGVKRTRRGSNSLEPVNLNRTLEPDLKRRVRIPDPPSHQIDEGKRTAGRLTHALDMLKDQGAKDYVAAFPDAESDIVLELQYPSASRPEKFAAVDPLDVSEGYSPLSDIYFSIEEMIQHYLPHDLAAKLSNDAEGTVRLLKRAATKKSIAEFQTELSKFNTLIQSKLADGTIAAVLDHMHAIPLSLVKRITAQSYNRIVSPHAHRLRKVKGKETTYGELLTPFVHKIFAQTGLTSSHVFVDLGSGVGNVVLQAALQTGAESWGIEKMDLAASLGSQQASELKARATLWNISLGPMTLLHGDFLDSPAIDRVLCRADVVLVNNKVFGETLNTLLLQKFLDLKEGCYVVSLERFGAGAKQGVRNEQSIAGLFDEERYESGTGSVSWAGESVEYFIARKVR